MKLLNCFGGIAAANGREKFALLAVLLHTQSGLSTQVEYWSGNCKVFGSLH